MQATVLIGEEEADQREYLADLLRAEGCEVYLAADTETALAIIADHTIDLLVIDMLLPGGGGFKCLSEFKSLRNGHAVMTSTNGSEDHQHYAQALGADLFLVKPFAVESLLGASRVWYPNSALAAQPDFA